MIHRSLVTDSATAPPVTTWCPMPMPSECQIVGIAGHAGGRGRSVSNRADLAMSPTLSWPGATAGSRSNHSEPRHETAAQTGNVSLKITELRSSRPGGGRAACRLANVLGSRGVQAQHRATSPFPYGIIARLLGRPQARLSRSAPRPPGCTARAGSAWVRSDVGRQADQGAVAGGGQPAAGAAAADLPAPVAERRPNRVVQSRAGGTQGGEQGLLLVRVGSAAAAVGGGRGQRQRRAAVLLLRGNRWARTAELSDTEQTALRVPAEYGDLPGVGAPWHLGGDRIQSIILWQCESPRGGAEDDQIRL